MNDLYNKGAGEVVVSAGGPSEGVVLVTPSGSTTWTGDVKQLSIYGCSGNSVTCVTYSTEGATNVVLVSSDAMIYPAQLGLLTGFGLVVGIGICWRLWLWLIRVASGVR